MKKFIAIMLLLSLLMVGCGDKDANTGETETGDNTAETQAADYPLQSDFEYTVTESVDAEGYGKFTVTNNSDYAIVYTKLLLRTADGVDIMLVSNESLLPGDTSPEATVVSEVPDIDLTELDSIWLEIKYLDKDKSEHIYRYDYKLERYEFY